MKKIWEAPALETLDVGSTFGGPEPTLIIDGPYNAERDHYPGGGS